MDSDQLRRTRSIETFHKLSSPRIKTQEIATQILSNVDDVIDAINQQEKKNFKAGVFLLLLAISTWIIGLELVNAVLKGDEYQKPLFIAVLIGSCFTFNFIPNWARTITSIFRGRPQAMQCDSPLLSTSDLNIAPTGSLEVSSLNASRNHFESASPQPLSNGEILSLAIQIALIYLGYNVFVLLALQFTSASNQTILGSTTTFFTLFLGVLLKIDKLSLKKLLCVVSSLIGVILINLSESSSHSNDHDKFAPKSPVFGNFLALIGALCYALYLLVMKLKCGTGNKTTNERELFGWVGVMTLILGVPLLLFAHVMEIEKFELPPNKTVLFMIMVNAIFSVISDYVTILAMLLTNPLVTSLALTSGIPITIFIDFLVLQLTSLEKSSSSNLFLYAFGVICILISVVLINVNITSENEFIEEVIEETLQEALRNDGNLSPVLSPFLSSAKSATSPPHDIGLHHFSPIFGLPKKKPNLSRPLSSGEVSKFVLNTNSQAASENSPLYNANHARSLYTIESNLGVHDEHGRASIMVLGGVNHSFMLKNVEQDEDE